MAESEVEAAWRAELERIGEKQPSDVLANARDAAAIPNADKALLRRLPLEDRFDMAHSRVGAGVMEASKPPPSVNQTVTVQGPIEFPRIAAAMAIKNGAIS